MLQPMPAVSAGLLMCRLCDGRLELLLAHPGGPFFARKDEGAWTIPKGLVDPGEDPLAAARRELAEETGIVAPEDDAAFVSLGHIVQKAGKRVHAWAFLGDCDPAALTSNTFEIEWPPRSGRRASFPEIDRIAFFAMDDAARKVMPAQLPLLRRAQQAFAP
jgi:predicted NUDIX family NTP pyrophosphohydrolase